jgi:hypothetical protein
MSGVKNNSQDFEKQIKDFLESNDLVDLYANADEQELRALLENAQLMSAMSDLKTATLPQSAQIQRVIKYEWQEEQTKPSSNIFDRLRAGRNEQQSSRLGYGRFALPVSVVAAVILALYLPTVKSTILNIAADTVSSLSGSIENSTQLSTGFYGIIIGVALILLFVISRREK